MSLLGISWGTRLLQSTLSITNTGGISGNLQNLAGLVINGSSSIPISELHLQAQNPMQLR